MTNKPNHLAQWAYGLGVTLLLLPAGCSKPTNNDVPAARTPKAAASQLDQVFTSANADLKNDAKIASEALRASDYEKAIQSLQTVKTRQNLTFEQGMAVHNSMVALESKVISAMDAGDPNAKRAFERLKQLSRD